jgi:hypothetical protein
LPVDHSVLIRGVEASIRAEGSMNPGLGRWTSMALHWLGVGRGGKGWEGEGRARTAMVVMGSPQDMGWLHSVQQVDLFSPESSTA